MAMGIQVVFDCANPDRLARFWAEALHYKVQDPPEGFATWEAFLISIGVPKEEWDDASAIVDPEGEGPRIYFQRMDTPKPAKNRIHLDVNASGGRKDSPPERRKRVDVEVERLLALGLGATMHHADEDGDWYFVTMLDPEGNEFDVH